MVWLCSVDQYRIAQLSKYQLIWDPYPLKNEIWGGESSWNLILKFHFCILFNNDQHSSSFHIIGKQMKIKFLGLAPEELSTCQTEAAHM